MKKILMVIICLYIIQSNQFNEIKKSLQNVFFKQNNEDKELTGLYEHMRSLEDIYNDKLLTSYDINPNTLKEVCANITDYEENQSCRKQYIMNHTKLTEDEYQDVFVHPISQFTNTKETTIKDVKESYEEIKEKINDLENLIDLISP